MRTLSSTDHAVVWKRNGYYSNCGGRRTGIRHTKQRDYSLLDEFEGLPAADANTRLLALFHTQSSHTRIYKGEKLRACDVAFAVCELRKYLRFHLRAPGCVRLRQTIIDFRSHARAAALSRAQSVGD